MTHRPIGRGTVLAGRFRLEDLVQDTDGARFWRAVDQILARNVAVNVIDESDARAGALLVAARTSATITEGHFLRVLDAADEDGVVYVVHEWGNGHSLDKILADGPLAPRRAAWLVKEVADAVTFAHGHGIAHGRLVPENVMVTEAGSVKLIGFVVDAVLHGRQPATPDGRELSDHESDVYGLAALLYAALTGKWPGSTSSSLPEAPVDHGRILRPRQVRAGVPRPLDTVCDLVLNPAPGQTGPETAHEISAALSDFIGDSVAPGLAGFEPTAVIDRDEQARFRPVTDTTTPVTEGGGDDPEATRAAPPPARDDRDPEATQAAAPPVPDDDEYPEPARRARRTAPPPPPPFPEPEERPLFAPGPPRAAAQRPDTAPHDPAAAVRGMHSTHGTGSLPAVWGPDDPDDDPDDEGAGPGRGRDAGKDWLRLAAAIGFVVVLVIAVVLAFNLGRGPGESPDDAASEGPTREASGPTRPLAVAAVSDLDPLPDGNGEENPDLAQLAVDGDPTTVWQTMEYYGDPKFGLLKEGVGLVLDLGDVQEVSSVEVTLQGRPTSLDILAAPEESGLPEDVEGLAEVASAAGVGGEVVLDLDEPVSTRYLVVWLTSLPPADSGYRGRIAEIVVRP